jgi:hypothetical protein
MNTTSNSPLTVRLVGGNVELRCTRRQTPTPAIAASSVTATINAMDVRAGTGAGIRVQISSMQLSGGSHCALRWREEHPARAATLLR